MKKMTIGVYTFTQDANGNITYKNNESGATGQPTAKGNVTYMLDGFKQTKTTAELIAMEGWQDVATDATETESTSNQSEGTKTDAPAEPAKTIEQLQQDVTAANEAITNLATDASEDEKTAAAAALKAATDALNEAITDAEIAKISASIAETRKKNADALQPLNDRLTAAKKAWQDAAALDTADMDTLMPLLTEVKAATAAVNAFVPTVDENEERLNDLIENDENEIERLKARIKVSKRMLGAATGKKGTSGERAASESTAWSELDATAKDGVRAKIRSLAETTPKTAEGKNDNAKIAELLLKAYATDATVTEAIKAAIPTKLIWVTLNRKVKEATETAAK